MDNAGWHAQRRADKVCKSLIDCKGMLTWVIQDAFRYFSRRRRGSDGQYVPEEEVGPLPNGHFATQSPPGASPPSYTPWPSNIVGSIFQYSSYGASPLAERFFLTEHCTSRTALAFRTLQTPENTTNEPVPPVHGRPTATLRHHRYGRDLAWCSANRQ